MPNLFRAGPTPKDNHEMLHQEQSLNRQFRSYDRDTDQFKNLITERVQSFIDTRLIDFGDDVLINQLIVLSKEEREVRIIIEATTLSNKLMQQIKKNIECRKEEKPSEIMLEFDQISGLDTLERYFENYLDNRVQKEIAKSELNKSFPNEYPDEQI